MLVDVERCRPTLFGTLLLRMLRLLRLRLLDWRLVLCLVRLILVAMLMICVVARPGVILLRLLRVGKGGSPRRREGGRGRRRRRSSGSTVSLGRALATLGTRAGQRRGSDTLTRCVRSIHGAPGRRLPGAVWHIEGAFWCIGKSDGLLGCRRGRRGGRYRGSLDFTAHGCSKLWSSGALAGPWASRVIGGPRCGGEVQ